MDDVRTEALKLLRYPREWEAFGLPDTRLLELQLETFRNSGDQRTEHYRFAAFRSLLEEGSMTDGRVDHYLILVNAEPDPAMARSALVELLLHRPLTDSQLDHVRRHPWFLSEPRLAKLARSTPGKNTP
jgi:hypothetical protein